MVKQYIGARYVPKFYEGTNGTEWEVNAYEPLTIVTYLGNSYTSKKAVPNTVGNPAENPIYWASTGNYNAQVEEYREEVSELSTKVVNFKIGNVKDYGAIGDGVHDDSLAFQNAIDENDKIYIPAGTYLVGSIELKNNLVVEGENIESTILTKRSSDLYVLGNSACDELYADYTETGSIVPDDVGLFNVVIKNLTINGNNTNGYGIKVFGRYFNFSNIVIKNFNTGGIFTAFGQHGDPSVTNNVEDLLESKFEFIKILHINSGNGWDYNGPHDSYVNECIFVDIKGWAFYENTPNSLGGGWITNCNCWEVYNGFYIKSGGRITQCAFTGYYEEITGSKSYGLYIDDVAGNVCCTGCVFGGMNYGLSLAGTSHYIDGQFYNNRTACIDIRSGSRSLITGIFTPRASTNATFLSSTSTPNALTIKGYAVLNGTSLSDLGVQDRELFSSLIELKTINGNIVNYPSRDGFIYQGWTPTFPTSNGKILTDDVRPTATTRGGVLQQTVPNVDPSVTVTGAMLNSLMASLRTAGVFAPI